MLNSLVIQSHRQPLPFPWIEYCLASVRQWSEANGYAYRFLCDELFESIPDVLMQKIEGQRVVASDLARLQAIKAALVEDYETVIWMDADFLIFDPEHFVLPDAPYAVGREVWIQSDDAGRPKAYKKVHNAFLMFRRGNSLLDFYLDTAERLLRQNQGSVPPQFIGPKLLTALHNVAQFPVMESAGMLSPWVIKDLVKGGGAALDLFIRRSPQAIAGANLCISSQQRGELSSHELERAVELLVNGMRVFSNELAST